MNQPPAPPPRSRGRTFLIIALAAAGLSVPCCGIVAAIAIPAFVNYARRAKTAEAQANLRNLSRGVEAFCGYEHGGTSVFPGPAGPTPAVPTSQRQATAFGPEWAGVQFAPSDGVYYSYSMVPVDGTTFLVRAVGDLDDDGVTSRFEARCVSVAPGSCECGEIEVTDELE